MLRTILVPLDGSPTAEDAVPMASRLARRRGASVELVLVREAPTEPLTVLSRSAEVKRMDEDDQRLAEEYLESVAARMREKTGAEVRGVALEGEVIGSLRERVESTGAELVAMCTHGRGGWSRFWLGSVAQELVRRVQVPLLLTRPHGPEEGQASPPPMDAPLRVLVTLDGSQYAEQALDAAIRVFGEESRYRLLRVVVPPVVHGYRVPKAHPDYVEQEKLTARATEYLSGQVEKLRERGLEVDSDVIARQHVAEGISDYAREEGMHTVAIATNARQGMPRLVLGSVADKVLRSSSVPVLVTRSPSAGRVPAGA